MKPARILVTTIVDLKRSAHSRLHRLVAALSDRATLTILSIYDQWKAERGGLTAAQQLLGQKAGQIIYFAPDHHSPRSQELVSWWRLPPILDKLEPQTFDLHVNYNSLVAGLRVARYLNNYRIPTMYDLADDLPAMVRSSPHLSGWLKPLAPLAEAVATYAVAENCRVAQRITVTTASLGETFHIPGNKMVVLPNGVDLDRFAGQSQKKARARWQIAPDAFVLGYVGVLREWTDFTPLFAALKHLPKQTVLLIAGGEGNSNMLKQQADRAGVGSLVRLLGPIPYQSVPEFVAALDVGLLPFRRSPITRHALPLKVFEYLAGRRPVITSPIGEVERIFGQAVWYAESSAELVAALTDIRRHPDRVTAKLAAAKRIIPQYDWERIADQFRDLVEREISHASFS